MDKELSKRALQIENLARLRRGRRVFRTSELTNEEVERITSARMDARHNKLNALLTAKA